MRELRARSAAAFAASFRAALLLFPVGLVPLAGGCSIPLEGRCYDSFCMPAGASLISEASPADFKLYQFEWQGNRFGIYAGDYPDFDRSASKPLELPVDPGARIAISGGEGQVLITVSGQPPQFLHLTGPCDEASACPVAELARVIERPAPDMR